MSAAGRRTILLLEDELLIAMDVQVMLAEADVEDVDIVSSCSAAEAWLADRSPAAAILDIRLRDGPATNVAHTLIERDIPFIVYSGTNKDSEDCDPVFLNGTWITKPCLDQVLVSAVKAFL
jgi:DNA-binding response OmpR family regulator